MTTKPKSKAKSRTSKTKSNNKISAPRWVIAVVLLIVVGTGAFLVYNSYAGSVDGRYIYCNQGNCQNIVTDRSNVPANQHGKSCRSVAKRAKYLCT